MSFTSVTQTGMTVNWVDNSTDESFFQCYFSQDGINYSSLGSIPSTTIVSTGTTYSQSVGSLLPGVTYYFRVASFQEGSPPSAYLSGNNPTAPAGEIFSVASGNWSDPATWSTGAVPTTMDNVTIADGHTVILNAAASCNGLTVGQGTSGILRYGTTATSLTVIQGVTVQAGGTFDAGAPAGASLSHTMSLGGTTSTANGIGSLTVNGTFDMHIGGSYGKATVTFYGIRDAAISGSGSIDFYQVILNKGNAKPTENSMSPVLDMQRACSGAGVATTGFISTHTAGTFKVSGTFTYSNKIYSSPGYDIGSLGALWIDNPNFTVTGQNGSPSNNGLLRLSSGTYNIGLASGNYMDAASGATFLIEGGTMNVTGRLNTSTAITYKQTGGTVNVTTGGNTSSGNPGFGITSTSSAFVMSGGTICVVLASTATTKIDYDVSAASTAITGGALLLGSGSSGTAKTYHIRGTTPNLTLTNTSANHNCNLVSHLTVKGDLTLNGTGTFNTGAYDVTMSGMSPTNPGNLVINTGAVFTINAAASKVLTFNSSFGNQSVTNDGTITGSELPSLVISNSYSGGTLTLPGGLTLLGDATLDLDAGTLVVGAGGLTLGTGGATGFTYIRGNGSTSGTISMNYGSGPVNYTYDGTAPQTTGSEMPSSISGEFTVNNNSGVTLNAALQSARLKMLSGALVTSSSHLLTITGVAATDITYTSGQVSGPLARTLPAGLAAGTAYLFPLGKTVYRPLELVNPVTGAGGTTVIRAEVFDSDCGGTPGSTMISLNTNRHWTADIVSGAGNFTSTEIRLTEDGLTSNHGIATSPSVAGTYDLASLTGPSGGTLLTEAQSSLGSFVIGTKKMNFVGSSCTQGNTSIIRQASVSQEIIGVVVVTSGNLDPASITSLTFSTNGSTNPSDITAARVFYTGSSSSFDTTSQFGTDFPNPSGNFTITGSQPLAEGSNYFWLAYDISLDAGDANLVDAECSSLIFNGTGESPAPQAPAGNRQLKAALSGTFTIGTSGMYPTLTGTGGLFEAINIAGLRGDLFASITTSLAEPGTYELGEIYEIGGSDHHVTIKPDAAAMRVISGSYAGGLLRISGADRITFEGSFGESGKYLNITNSSTSGTIAAIQLISPGPGQGSENVTIANCNISNGHNGTGSYAIYAGGAALGSAGNDHDSLVIRDCNISKAHYGIYALASASGVNDNLVITGDTVGSTTISSYVSKSGIYLSHCNGARIEGNTIFNISSSSTKPVGIYLYYGCINSSVSGNKIHGIIYTGSSDYGGTGLLVTTNNAASNLLIANNLIFDISGKGDGTLESNAITGISILANSGDIDLYYNSVCLSGSVSGASTGDKSAAFYSSVSVPEGVNLKNNIFQNSIDNIAGTAIAYAIYTLTEAVCLGSIDYNVYYAEGPEAKLGHIYFYDVSNLNQLRSYTYDDAHSVETDPLFAGPTDLRIDLGSPARSGGVPISGITVDFEGVARSLIAPNMGAYESAEDNQGPVFTYTPLQKTAALSSRTLTASLVDSTGIPVAGTGLPVLYWKINAGSWISAQGSYLSGNDYQFTFGGGVTVGDVVSYYIVAQDTDTPPNISASPSFGAEGFSADPPACGTPPSTPQSYTIVEGMSGVVTVGSGETYTSLSGASGLFKKINDNLLTGNLVAEISTNLTEDGTNALNEWLEEGAGTYTLTIRPASASEKLISGNPVSQAMIRFNGADRVIIDGSSGGSGKYLRFRNENTMLSLFTMINGACFDTIRHCHIESNCLHTLTGTIFISTSTAATGNSFNAIMHNSIHDRTDLTGIPYAAIYASGTSGKENVSNTIAYNEISNFTSYGIYVTSGNGSNWSILGNSFYDTQTVPPTSSQRVIYFSPGQNSVSNRIADNYIGGRAPQCKGDPWVNAGLSKAFYGIYVYIGLYTPSLISGNTVQNVSLTTSDAGTLIAIYISDGYANVIGNMIGHPDNDSTLITATTSRSIEGIRSYSDEWRGNIEENTITNLILSAGSGYPEATGIYVLNSDIRKNTITRVGNCLYSGIQPYIYGIYNYGLYGYFAEITNNVIALDGGASSDPQIYGYMEYSYSINEYSFFYNSISISGPPTLSENTYAFYKGTDATYELRNNILANFREAGGTGMNYAFYTEYTGFIDSDYNDLYCPDGMIGYYDYTDLPTLADWQTATGQDYFSISSDPLFADTMLDLRPSNLSPVVTAGVYADWVTDDIEGNPRNILTPTMGAYEIEPPPAKTWNGTVSVDWTDPANWTPAGVPTSTENIIIPAGTPNSCSPGASGLTCRHLTVENGATLSLSTLAVITVHGRMIIQAGATVNNEGNIVIAEIP